MNEPDAVSDGEAELVGLTDRPAIQAWLGRAMRRLLGVGLDRILFRAGRIDLVYGLATDDGRRLLIKVHRPPVDLVARRVVAQAQRVMAEQNFPCAEPLVGPVEMDGKVVSVETLLPEAERGDGHDPAIRAAMAAGLGQHIAILSKVPGLAERVGQPPAWCLYQRGAWSASHMSFFDFRTTPPEYRWLQRFAQDAADRILELREPGELVAAHADWCGANLRFETDRLAAAFDWDLVADTEPIVVGLTAGMFSDGTAITATPPAPEETSAFLSDYEVTNSHRFDLRERSLAVAAASWSIAYTARCDVTLVGGSAPRRGSALDVLANRRAEYSTLDW